MVVILFFKIWNSIFKFGVNEKGKLNFFCIYIKCFYFNEYVDD